MAEKIIIYEGQINLERPLRSIKDMREQNKELKKILEEVGDEGSKAFELIKKRAEASGKTIEEESKEIRKQYSKNRDEILQFNRELRSGSTAAEDSYKGMNERLTQLRKRYRELSKAERETFGPDLLQDIAKLDKELKDLDAGMGIYFRNVGNYKSALDGFGQAVLGVAAAVGIGIGINEVVDEIQKAIEVTEEYRAELADLQSILGVTKDVAEEYSVEAKRIGLETTVSATEAVKAFKLIGSARPELLKSKEELVGFTEAAITLSEASKDLSLEQAANAVTGIANQFNLASSEVNRLTNTLAAGSKAGAVEVPALAESINKFGANAASANISIEETVALVELLGEKNIQGAESGTKLRNVINKLSAAKGLPREAVENLEKYGVNLDFVSDKTVPFAERLTELSKIVEDDVALTKVFGQENLLAGRIILENIDIFEEYTDAVTGTNTVFEQAAINSATQEAAQKRLANTLQVLRIEVGERLEPAMIRLIDTGRKLATGVLRQLNDNTSALNRTINFFRDNASKIPAVLTLVITAIAAWNAAKIKSIALDAKQAVSLKITNALKAVDAARTAVAATATKAYAVAKGVLTGQITLASAAQRVWNFLLASNPIGLVITAVGALTAALLYYNRNNKQAIELDRQKNELHKELEQSTNDVKNSQRAFNETIQNFNTLSRESREELVKNIELKKQEALATLEALRAKQQEVALEAARPTLLQQLGNAFLSGGNAANSYYLNTQSALKNSSKAFNEFNDEIDALEESIKGYDSQLTVVTDRLNAYARAQDVAGDSVSALREKSSLLQTALDDALIGSPERAKIQKELDQVNGKIRSLTNTARGLSEEVDKANKNLEETAEVVERIPDEGSIAAIRKDISQLRQDLEYTNDEAKRFELNNQIQELTKNLKELEQPFKVLSDAPKEGSLAALEAELSSLQNSFKLATSYDERFKINDQIEQTKDKIKELEKPFVELAEDGSIDRLRERLSELNKAFSAAATTEDRNVIAGQIRELKEEIEGLEEPLRRISNEPFDISEITYGGEPIENAISRLQNFGSFLGGNKDGLGVGSAVNDLNDQYENGLISAQEYEEQLTEIVREGEAARRDARLQAAEGIIGGVSATLNNLNSLYEAQKEAELAAAGDSAEERERIEKKYAKKQAKLATITAIADVAQGILKAISSAPFPANIPAIAFATIQGAIQLAVVKKQASKLAKGDIIRGKLHSEGGELRELEDQEMVVTRGAGVNKKSRGVVSFINQMFGGKKYGGSVEPPEELKKSIQGYLGNVKKSTIRFGFPKMQAGGVAGEIPRSTVISMESSNNKALENKLDQMVETITNLKLAVSVEEINTVQDRVEYLESNGELG